MKKSSFYHTPLAFDAPLGGGFPSEYRHPLWDGKTRMVPRPDGKKNFTDIFIRFDVIHERDRQMDGHWMTAKTALASHHVVKMVPIW